MKKTKIIIMIFMFMVTLSFMAFAFAETLSDGDKVKANSELTYYLNIEYDGVDETATVSGANVTANVKSDYIEVSDKIPDGLTFDRIVDPGSGQIGAVKRSDNETTCSGYVVDGVKGVTYNTSTRTVSFKVRNLGAGCKLTVGVVVTTPADTGERQDFYNTFQASEDELTIVSNTVHVYMGEDDVERYEVEYKYTGTIPSNAPMLPVGMMYAKDANVVVENDVNLAGYEFSGWDSDDVNVSNGKFKMPAEKVTLEGEFTKKTSYKVTYQIKGDAPKNYVVPSTETYYENMSVTVDSLQKDEIVDGYRFLGWETTDVKIDEGLFQMPTQNVTITGSFERISYEVSYEFIGTVKPTDSASLLPSSSEYYPGDKVTLELPGEASGFKFLGWYKKDNFVMPEEDVVIQGEWGVSAGLFEPKITKEIVNVKDKYILGDVVKFKITVTNTADYEIKNVMVRENHDKAKFVSGNGYEVTSDHIATIDSMKKGETVTLYSEYEVTEDSLALEENEVEIVGALADNNYNLDDSKDYKAKVEFKTENNVILAPNTDANDNHIIEIVSGLLILCGVVGVIYAVKKRKKEK